MRKILPFLFVVAMVSSAMGVTTYRYSDNVTNLRGDVVGGAYVTVYNANSTTKATIYIGDNSSTQEKANPARTDGYGRFWFYAPPGTYDITISGANITTYTIEDVRLYSENDYTYNVNDYGASVSDTLSDVAAINAAIRAAGEDGGGPVRLPAGDFYIDRQITVGYDNIALVGSGMGATRILRSYQDSAFSAVVFDTVSNCSISGLTIDGFAVASRPGDSKVYGVVIYGGNNNTVTDCYIANCGSAGIAVHHNYTAYWAQTYADRAVPKTAIDGGGHIISNNFIVNTTEGHGIEMMRADGCIVSNNYISDSKDWGIRNCGTYNAVVSGNNISGCLAGITFQGYGDARGVLARVNKDSRRGTISGNTIEGDTGIKVFNGAFDCNLIGNTITSTDDTGGVGIELAATADTLNTPNAFGNVVIASNNIKDGAIGITIEAGGYGADVRSNVVSNFDWIGVQVSSTAAGDTIRGVTISGNTVRPGWNSPSRSVKVGLVLIGSIASGDQRSNIYDTFGYSGSWVNISNTSGIKDGTLPGFTAAAAPDTVGQRGLIWYDKVNDKLKVYTGSGWANLH